MYNLDVDDPRAIGPYTITKVLGQGGMGRVYLGRKGATHAAIKVIQAKQSLDMRSQIRFRREIEATKKVAIKQIAKVIDSGASGSMLWYASEYVPGPTLEEAAHTAPLRGEALVNLAHDLYEALKAIHAAGIIHRDLKPSNIIMGADGLRVIDFGIAFMADLPTLTREGTMVGTLGYMSPEQMDGMTDPERSWDIFAYGCVLAYAATGRPPFTGNSEPAIMHAVLHQEPDLDGIQPTMRRLIERCLQKDKRNRAALGDIARLLPKPQVKQLPPTRLQPDVKLPPTRLQPSPQVVKARAAVKPIVHPAPNAYRRAAVKPVSPAPARERAWTDTTPWYKRDLAIIGGLALLLGGLLFVVLHLDGWLDRLDPQPDTTQQTAAFDVPAATFTPAQLSSSGNPAVTNVKVEHHRLYLSIKLGGSSMIWTDLLTKSCVVVLTSTQHYVTSPANAQSSVTQGDVIDYGAALDYAGEVRFYAKCPTGQLNTTGQKLGTNRINTLGVMSNGKDTAMSVITSYIKDGGLHAVVRQYDDYSDARYKSMCLKTSAGLQKPVMSKATVGGDGYVILAFKAKAGTLYLECTGNKQISYTGTGVKLS